MLFRSPPNQVDFFNLLTSKELGHILAAIALLLALSMVDELGQILAQVQLDETVGRQISRVDLGAAKTKLCKNPHISKPGADERPKFICASCGSINSETHFFDDNFWDDEEGQFYCEECWWMYTSHGHARDADRNAKVRKISVRAHSGIAPGVAAPAMKPRSVSKCSIDSAQTKAVADEN